MLLKFKHYLKLLVILSQPIRRCLLFECIDLFKKSIQLTVLMGWAKMSVLQKEKRKIA